MTNSPENPSMMLEVELIDDNPLQPRIGDPRDVAELAADIESNGLLQPIIVVRKDDGRYTLLVGRRRLAAHRNLARKLIETKILTGTADDKQIAAIMAENIQRDDFTPIEEARGFQTMIDLGVKRTTIAKAFGLKPAEVGTALKVVNAPERVVNDAVTHTMSFEEAEGLQEFADDDEAYAKLLNQVGSGQFKHTLETLRSNRDRAAKVAEITEELEGQGVKVLAYSWEHTSITDYRIDLTPETHKDCPGHAAMVATRHDGPEAVYICTDPKKHHGYGGKPKKTDAEKQHDRAKREMRAELKPATTVRLEFVKGALSDKALMKTKTPALLNFVADEAAKRGGLPSLNEYGVKEIVHSLLPASPNDLQTLGTLATAKVEKSLADHIKFTGGVKGPNEHGWDTSVLRFAAYYAFLTAAGYTLSDAEERWMKSGQAEKARKEVAQMKKAAKS